MNEYVNIYHINKSENDADNFIKDLSDSGNVVMSRKNVSVTIPEEIPKNKNNQQSDNSLAATLYSTADHPRLSTQVRSNENSNTSKTMQRSESIFSECADQDKRGRIRKLV